jgi:hypothetical protein
MRIEARLGWVAAALGLAAALAAPSLALVVATDDVEATLRPPPEGDFWANVGKLGGTTGVYLGGGWVITAAHAGPGAIQLGGRIIQPVDGSEVTVGNGEGEPPADLLLYRIDPAPALPSLVIPKRSPRPGERVVLVGYGHGRGEEIRWRGASGYRWEALNVGRWGRNFVAPRLGDFEQSGRRTRTFLTVFDPGAAPFEAQAARGDSGGGAFVKRRPGWRLAGLMVSVSEAPGQQPGTSLKGNATYLADLAHYRAEIVAITGGR